jgi:hypothetical protein
MGRKEAEVNTPELPAMSSSSKFDWIEIGAQISGPDAYEFMAPHFKVLHASMDKHVSGPFSDKISQFSFLLRVDGSVRSWDLPRLSHIDLNKRNKYISIDVHIPGKVWKSGDVSVAKHIGDAFREGLRQMIECLKLKGVDVRAGDVTSALNAALTDYTEWASTLS